MKSYFKAFLGFSSVFALSIVLAAQTASTLSYVDASVTSSELTFLNTRHFTAGKVLGVVFAATPTPAPAAYQSSLPAPTKLSITCSADGKTVTSKWVAPSGYNTFYFRAQIGATSSNWAPEVVQDDVVGTTTTFSSQSGKDYNIWVHTKNPVNGNWSDLIQGTVVCKVAPTPTPTPTVIGTPTPTPTPETINTLDFFLTNHPEKSLTGSHPISQTIAGQNAYYVKWDNVSYEIYSWDDSYIYLNEDHSGTPNPQDYTFTPGKWLKRQMKVGETIDVSDNRLQWYDHQTCAVGNNQAFPYKIVLEQHIPNYNMGGSLGTQDVIVVKYDYSNATLKDFERSYYSKEWGWVKWEFYKNGVLSQTSTFNNFTSQPPIAPNLGLACSKKTTPPSGGSTEYLKKQTLVFSIDQGFSNGMLALGDTVGLERMISNLKQLQTKYEVYVSVEPKLRDKTKIDKILDVLVKNNIPFVFDVYASDNMSVGNDELNLAFDVPHGRAMSIEQIGAYKTKYGNSFAGLRSHEVFASNFTILACQKLGVDWCDSFKNNLPKDNFYQKAFLEEYIKFANEKGMFFMFQDFYWSAYHPWDFDKNVVKQEQNEQELKDLINKYPNTVVIMFANNEPAYLSRSKKDTWTDALQPVINSSIKGFGLSDQSWMCESELSPEGGKLSGVDSGKLCPPSEIASWASTAFAKGAKIVQFEPSWYLWNFPKATIGGLVDYTKDAAWKDRGAPSSALVELGKVLGVTISSPVVTLPPIATTTPPSIFKTSVIIRANGTPVDTVYPNMELRAGDKLLKSWTVTATSANYVYQTNDDYSSSKLRVTFTNDAYKEPQDRNLIVDYLDVNGKKYLTTDPSIYSVGSWTPANGCEGGYKKLNILACNGYFEFQIQSSVTPTPTPIASATPSPTSTPNPTPTPTPIPTPDPSLKSEKPIGYFDLIQNGVAIGWAADPDVPAQSIDVHFYLDKPAGSGGMIGYAGANVLRSDVNKAVKVTGNHGFEFSIPAKYRDGKTHTLYVYGIDAGKGENPLLTGSPKTFNLLSGVIPTPTPTPNPVKPVLQTPVPNSTLSGPSQTFSWGAVAGATKYWLDVGNSQGQGDISAGELTATSKTISNLPTEGGTLYIRLWSFVNGAYSDNFNDYKVTAASTDNTPVAFGATATSKLGNYPRPKNGIQTMFYTILGRSSLDQYMNFLSKEIDYLWFDQSSLAYPAAANTYDFSDFYKGVGQLTALNPNMKIGTHAGSVAEFGSYHLPYSYLSDSDFLHDTSGNLIKDPAEDTFRFLNVSSPAARQKLVSAWKDIFAKNPSLSGINMDGYELYYTRPPLQNGCKEGACNTAGFWFNGITSLSQELRAALPGKDVTYNGLFFFANYSITQGPMNSGFVDYNDGVLSEWPHEMYNNPQVFAQYLTVINSITAKNKKVFFWVQPKISNAYTPDLNLERFFLSSYLLIQNNPLTYFGYHPGDIYSPTPGIFFYPDWNKDYGLPQGTYTSSSGLYTRVYQNGIAVVNPNGYSQTFNFPDSRKYKLWDAANGAEVSGSITIPANTGNFYFVSTSPEVQNLQPLVSQTTAGVCQNPTNITPTSTITGNTTSLSWSPVPGAVSYNIRLDDGTTDRYLDTRFANCLSSPHYYCVNGITSTSVANVPVKPGRSYNFWIDPVYSPERNYCNGVVNFSTKP